MLLAQTASLAPHSSSTVSAPSRDWNITQIPPGGLQAPHQDLKAPAFLVTFSPMRLPPTQSFLGSFQHAPEPSPWDSLLSLIKTVFPQGSIPITKSFTVNIKLVTLLVFVLG